MVVSKSGERKPSPKNLDWEDYKDFFFRFNPDAFPIGFKRFYLIYYPIQVLIGLVVIGLYQWFRWVEGK
jgi:hypothetical protein